MKTDTPGAPMPIDVLFDKILFEAKQRVTKKAGIAYHNGASAVYEAVKAVIDAERRAELTAAKEQQMAGDREYDRHARDYRLDVYHHFLPDPRAEDFHQVILGKLHDILTNTEQMMATLDETLDATTEEDTKVDSIIAFLTGIEQQLADALSGANLPPAVQAKVDQLFSQAKAASGRIDTAINAGTPPAP